MTAGAEDYAAAIDEYAQNPYYRAMWPSEGEFAKELARDATWHLNAVKSPLPTVVDNLGKNADLALILR